MSNRLSESSSIETASLKPVFQELLYKDNSRNTSFDALSCQGTTYQEKSLGHLFVLGHVRYNDEEDMSYLINLISSLAKREYYSPLSIQEQNPRASFERTLKKLNEVLENFFTNKNLQIDIGLIGLVGEDIFLSRIGRLKVGLARNNEYIDVINNIELFAKDAQDNAQFSSVISGKVKPHDKIFAYIPLRSINAREKSIKTLFVNHNQEEFGQKIAQLASDSNTFACCAIHIALEEIKEIPVQRLTPYQSFAQTETVGAHTAAYDMATDQPINQESPAIHTSYQLPSVAPVISQEMSVAKRSNISSNLSQQIRALARLPKLKGQARFTTFFGLAGLVILPLVGFALYRSLGTPSDQRLAYSLAQENQKLAATKADQGDIKDARSLLTTALIKLSHFNTKKALALSATINENLDKFDKTSSTKAELVKDLSQDYQGSQFNKIAYAHNQLIGLTSSGDLVALLDNSGNIGRTKMSSAILLGNGNSFSVFNDFDKLETWSVDGKTTMSAGLKNTSQVQDGVLYHDNLYTVHQNIITKFEDAAKGTTKGIQWASLEGHTDLQSVTIDGNIYVLDSNGTLTTLYKGKEISHFESQLNGINTKILTTDSDPNLYIIGKDNQKIYAFNKKDGTLTTSYKIDFPINDAAIGTDNSIYILSNDNKIWKLGIHN